MEVLIVTSILTGTFLIGYNIKIVGENIKKLLDPKEKLNDGEYINQRILELKEEMKEELRKERLMKNGTTKMLITDKTR